MSFILEALLHNNVMCEIKIRFRLSLLHHLAARRISRHPAGKPCRVFALTPAARFPLASRPPPYRVLYILPFFVLPTLAGTLRSFRARRISRHPAGKPCRVFALTPAARFPLASRPPPYRVLCILSFFVLPTLAGALRAFSCKANFAAPCRKSCRVFALTPAARFPLASRTLPHKVSSLRFAPLRYFAGTPSERFQSGRVRIHCVLPTLAGAVMVVVLRRVTLQCEIEKGLSKVV